jgi:hypothetical protein
MKTFDAEVIGADGKLRNSTFHEDFVCRVDRLEHDYSTHTLRVWVPPLNVPNMSGSIRVATRIDPLAVRIEFVCEGVLVHAYMRKTAKSAWISRRGADRRKVWHQTRRAPAAEEAEA